MGWSRNSAIPKSRDASTFGLSANGVTMTTDTSWSGLSPFCLICWVVQCRRTWGPQPMKTMLGKGVREQLTSLVWPRPLVEKTDLEIAKHRADDSLHGAVPFGDQNRQFRQGPSRTAIKINCCFVPPNPAPASPGLILVATAPIVGTLRIVPFLDVVDGGAGESRHHRLHQMVS